MGYKGVFFPKFFCMVFVLSPRTIAKNYLGPCMPFLVAVGDLWTKIRPKLGRFWAPRATPLQNFVFFFQIMITGIHTVNMIPLLTHFHSWSWKVLQIPLVQKTGYFKINYNVLKKIIVFGLSLLLKIVLMKNKRCTPFFLICTSFFGLSMGKRQR